MSGRSPPFRQTLQAPAGPGKAKSGTAADDTLRALLDAPEGSDGEERRYEPRQVAGSVTVIRLAGETQGNRM